VDEPKACIVSSVPALFANIYGVQVKKLCIRLYGGQISAALWIASASWQAKGTTRIVGWLLAFDLAIYSLIAFLPLTFVVLVPSLVLLPLWFVLVGRLLSREREY